MSNKVLAKKRTLLIVLIATLVLFAAYFTWASSAINTETCTDIIGDGYAMGLDEEPVVIGNTCD